MGHDFFIFSKMQYDNIVSICRSDFWKQAKLNSFIHQFIQTMKWMRGLNVCHNGKCLNNVLISAPSFGQMTLCWDVSSLVISWNHMLIKQCGPKNICISCSPWELLKSFYTEKKKKSCDLESDLSLVMNPWWKGWREEGEEWKREYRRRWWRREMRDRASWK